MRSPSTTAPAIALVALLVLSAGRTLPGVDPESRAGAYDYTFGLDAYGTLSNFESVPLPAEDGASVPNASALAPNGTVDGSFEASVVDTRYGPMLELRTEEFVVEPRYFTTTEDDGMGRRVEISEAEYDPENSSHSKVEFRSVDVLVTVGAPYPIDTETPVGDEPLLPTAGERVATVCEVPTTDGASCFDHDAPVYLECDAADDARVDTIVAFEGRNEWFDGAGPGITTARRSTTRRSARDRGGSPRTDTSSSPTGTTLALRPLPGDRG